MSEEILHYVWRYRLFQQELKTTKGEPIEVIDVGIPNTDQGPDFFNSKVKIGDKLWAGNIEIHCVSSDWKKHKHQVDENYNSVILHVVEKADCEVYNQLDQNIPQCKLVYPSHIRDNYSFLRLANADIPCANYIQSVPSIHLSGWMNNLLFERLERKSKNISDLLDMYNNSWEDVFYILLSRNMGFGLNSDAFERLARSLPYIYIQKHRDNIVQIEAMLFGQAGLLDKIEDDNYSSLLKKEYEFLNTKFELERIDSLYFKKLRTRPSAFPQIRVAQLAALLHSSQSLFSKIIACKDIGKIRLLFHANASEYWQTHYQFGIITAKKSKYIGDSSLDIILINTVIPILFSYGKAIGSEDICDRAISFLETINAEKNSITKCFAKLGLPMENAADSQACIQLKREYCELRKCLFCRIGHRFLTEK